MITINNAARLIKRAILANIATDKQDVSITPLISGQHGIGKSAIVKSVAHDLGGVCITIEGGTLKEGEITGLPYQYEDRQGKPRFRFLPYYAVERIQAQEKLLFEASGKQERSASALSGNENAYAQNDISSEEKIDLLLSGKIQPVIVFVDEVNRTENTVYKELMNILLTKTVNGYRFPWWVFFVGAMNPSTQNSVYATNEMDPAQLDRFLKLKVTSNANEWVRYGKKAGIPWLSKRDSSPKSIFIRLFNQKIFQQIRYQTAYGRWRGRPHRHYPGTAAFRTFWLNYGILKLKEIRIRHNPKKSMEINRNCGL